MSDIDNQIYLKKNWSMKDLRDTISNKDSKYKQKFEKLKFISVKISQKNEKLREENEKQQNDLTSSYNLLYSKDKQINFLQKKEEFLKNINIYKKLRKKLFKNIIFKMNPHEIQKKHIFILWKFLSKYHKKPTNLCLDKFFIFIDRSKLKSKLILKNEITLSMINLKNIKSNLIFSKFDLHIISNKLKLYGISIFLFVFCSKKIKNDVNLFLFNMKERVFKKLFKEKNINQNFMYLFQILKRNIITIRQMTFNQLESFYKDRNRYLYQKIHILNKLKIFVIIKNKTLLTLFFRKYKKITLKIKEKEDVYVQQSSYVKSSQFVNITANFFEKFSLKIKFYSLNKLKFLPKKEFNLASNQFNLPTDSNNAFNFSLDKIDLFNKDQKNFWEINKQENFDLFNSKKLQNLFSKENCLNFDLIFTRRTSIPLISKENCINFDLNNLKTKSFPLVYMENSIQIDLINSKKMSFPLVISEHCLNLDYKGNSQSNKAYNLINIIFSLYKLVLIRSFLTIRRLPLSKTENIKIDRKGLVLTTILNKRIKISKLRVFMKINSFSCFRCIQNSMFLSRKIILSTKLNCLLIIKQKAYKYSFLKLKKNIYLSRLLENFNQQFTKNKISSILILSKFIQEKIHNTNQYFFTIMRSISDTQSKEEIVNFFSKRLFLSKFLINCSRNISKCDLVFEKWKNTVEKEKSNEIKTKMKVFEEEFLSKIESMEKNYSIRLITLSRKNDDLEGRLKLKEDQINEINEEFQNLKNSYQAKTNALADLTKMVESSRNNISTYDNNIKIILEENLRLNTLVNELNNKANNFESYRTENQALREKVQEYEKNIKVLEKKRDESSNKSIKELERKYKELEKSHNSLKEIYDNLKFEFDDKLKKIDNSKRQYSQATEELIKTNNELSKTKSEIIKLNDVKTRQLDELSALRTEMNQKERTIKQLQLSEQSVSHDYLTQIEKLETKLKSERDNFNHKVNYIEKEKEIMSEQIKNLTKSNKTITDKMRSLSDYSSVKNDNELLKDRVSSLEGDIASFRIHNSNLQKNNEKIVDKLNDEIKRNEDLKLELLDFKNAAKLSSDQLKTALDEMGNYGLVLSGLEEKMKKLEDSRIQAEKDRDSAKNEVNEIRQRYINIMGSKSNF